MDIAEDKLSRLKHDSSLYRGIVTLLKERPGNFKDRYVMFNTDLQLHKKKLDHHLYEYKN